MRRTVLIVPDLLSDGNLDSLLRQKLAALEVLAELGALSKLAPMPTVETPEALYLGLSPTEAQLRQGPLTVSALGADPPDRSMHFHLSLMGYDDGVARAIEFEIPPEETRSILAQLKRLNTRLLTIVEGEGVDHGLVWEELGDLGTTSAVDVSGKLVRQHLPEGDGEAALRQMIDDSVNLLSELELNRRRLEEGLPPINLIWPWGQGVRKSVPNLFLRRGERGVVESSSLRLAGLVRLASYVHGDRSQFGRGMNTRFEPLAKRLLGHEVSITLISAISELKARNQMEEAHWYVHRFAELILQPLLDAAMTDPSRLTLLAPSSSTGLALSFDSLRHRSNNVPFDERALEEKALTTVDVWSAVEQGLN